NPSGRTHGRQGGQKAKTSPVGVQGLASGDRRCQRSCRMKKKKTGKLPSRRQKRVGQRRQNGNPNDPSQPRSVLQIIAWARIRRDPRSRQAVRGRRQAGKRGSSALDLAKHVVVACAGEIGASPSFPQPEERPRRQAKSPRQGQRQTRAAGPREGPLGNRPT